MSKSQIKRTERGWPGHYILGHECLFRRNTLLECGDTTLVVSTVGLKKQQGSRKETRQVAPGRYFETMAFHSDPEDLRYHDADVHRRVSFDSAWMIAELDADDRANNMHEAVVTELMNRLANGEITFERADDDN